VHEGKATASGGDKAAPKVAEADKAGGAAQ
jgi:multidrug efflux system membrane fusion protein